MPRAKQNKFYRTFVKGLITEAGYLTYPEDASVAELNTILSRKGNRTRRLGIDYENNHVLVDINAAEGLSSNEFVWHAAAEDSSNNFLCQQMGSTVHFFSLEATPVSDSHESFTVDLLAYKAPGASNNDVETNYASFASGEGFLFIVHPYVEPLSVEYDPLTNTINVVQVIVQVRDFEGVYDGLANDEEPSELSKEHHYNLMNQGWVGPGTIGSGGGNTSTYIDPYTGEPREYSPGGQQSSL